MAESCAGTQAVRFSDGCVAEDLECLQSELEESVHSLKRKKHIRGGRSQRHFQYDSRTGKRLRVTPAPKFPRLTVKRSHSQMVSGDSDDHGTLGDRL